MAPHMTHAKTAFLVSTILLLSACGDSETPQSQSGDAVESSQSTESSESAESESFEGTGGEPGLTDEEIDDPTLAVFGSYDINGETLEDGIDGPPDAETIETFETYTGLIPAEYRENVTAFVAIDQEASDGTDGALQDVIGPDDEPTGDRYLALDVTGYSEELERTIVHETGHYLFVNPDYTENEYAEAFNEQFPPGADYKPEKYVTEYAASSPEDGGEDIAESWAMFVYGDTEYAGDADDDGELDVVEPGSVAAEKVAFFEDYPELVELRADILN